LMSNAGVKLVVICVVLLWCGWTSRGTGLWVRPRD
jgi:hypothetical protein